MSKITKITLLIVVIIIVLGRIWWIMSKKTNNMSASVPASNNSSSAMDAAASSSASYPQGDSDQSINQDVTSLNAQLNGLNSDNASVTQSMNDQPVSQAE